MVCCCSCLTYFAYQIPNLMYADSIFDSYYASCINVAIHYASASLYLYASCYRYLYNWIRTFFDIMRSTWFYFISPIHQIISNPLCSVFSDPFQSDMLTLIWSDIIWYDMIWYDMIQFDLIWSDLVWSLLFDKITIIWYYPLYYADSNPISSECSLFTTVLFQLFSSEPLNFLKITDHYDISHIILEFTIR